MRLLVTALKELFWLSCLMWGILFMIAAATEGFPFTSIHSETSSGRMRSVASVCFWHYLVFAWVSQSEKQK